MSDFHCLDIEFPKVDFNSYSVKGEIEVNKVHHAHLTSKDNEVELKIFFDDRSCFGDKFMLWTSKVDWGKLGTFLKVEVTKNHRNEHLQKVDLSEAKLIGCANSTNYCENGKKYIIVKIDTAKYYWYPVEHEKLTAELYLDDKGFRVVEPFYSFLSPKSWVENDGEFELGRMNDSSKFYQFGDSTFRPEYNFVTKDDGKERVATITKEPIIKFKYNNGITEKEAIFYGDVVLMLASFYYHIKIDCTLRRIHLLENTITIKNIEQKNFIETSGSLWGFEIYWDFNKFLQSSWQEETEKNFALLSKAITLFNQSHIVDNSSAFLIRYNIIEICGKASAEDGVWNFALKNDDLDIFFSDIRERISNIIEASEQEHFNNKWISIQNIIKSKSLRKQLEDTLTNNDIDVKTLPIKTRRIVLLRNNITHGSLDKVDQEELRKVNILLYRICGILILNLMGIKDWKLNTIIN